MPQPVLQTGLRTVRQVDQLRTGCTFDDQLSPSQVGTANNWAMIAAGSKHSLAIKTDGTLWSWGLNSDGQVGNGNNLNQLTPQMLGDGKNWKAISAGQFHSLAVRTDGTLWIWGRNLEGQLGDGKRQNLNAPFNLP